MEGQKTQNNYSNMQEEQAGELTLTQLKIYYKATIIFTV